MKSPIDKGESLLKIWGWSEDGKVAYSIASFGYARGGFTISYYILDTITDNVLCHLIFDSFDYDIEALSYEKASYVYNENINNILTANNKYGIIENYSVFQKFPLEKDNYKYTLYLCGIYIFRLPFRYRILNYNKKS